MGLLDGDADGSVDGDEVGSEDGVAEGDELGSLVGCAEGEADEAGSTPGPAVSCRYYR